MLICARVVPCRLGSVWDSVESEVVDVLFNLSPVFWVNTLNNSI